jgi:hypothetical protein
MTNSMEQSLSLEAYSHSACQEMPPPPPLWSPNVHYRAQKILPSVPILNQMNPAHTFESISPRSILILSCHLSLCPPRGPFPSGFQTKLVYAFLISPTQPPVQWVPGALYLGVKRSGCEADHSPSIAEFKNTWSYISTNTRS